MASFSNPTRTTVCITEAFGFLDDPDYDKDPQALKKSTSDTNLFVSSDKKFDDLQARIHSLSTKNQQELDDSYTRQSKKASLLQNKNDTYTIITYLSEESTSADKNQHVHDSGIGAEDLDVSDNFTIVTYVEDRPKRNEKYDSDRERVGESKGDDNKRKDTNGHVLDEYELNVNDNYRKSAQHVGYNASHTTGNDHSEVGSHTIGNDQSEVGSHTIGNDQSEVGSNLHMENGVIMRHLSSNDLDDSRQSSRVSEEVLMRRQSTNTDKARSRRTQQIVSDAFHFLKELDYCDPDTVSLCSLSFHDKTNKELQTNENSQDLQKDENSQDLQKDKNSQDLQKDENSHVPKIEQDNMSSPMSAILSPDDKRAKNQFENCRDILVSHQSEFTNESIVNIDPLVIRRQQFQRQSKESASQDDDDSSDDDIALKLDRRKGVYNESFRNSCWLKVADNMSLSSVQESLEDDNYDPSSTDELPSVHSNDQSDHKENKDEVFLENNDQSHDYRGHNRSDSVTTTLSEREFKKQFNFRRKCLVKRNDSQQEYHRLSAKLYDNEKVIVIEKSVEDKDFGLHIIDSHPAIITNVDKGSPAYKAGVRQGLILITVNGVSVLESNHDEIIDLVQQDPLVLKIEVASSNFHYIRDLQTPLQHGYMYKQTSALIKTWRRRYFILRHDNCLYYYKNEQDEDPLGAIPLLNYTVSRHQDNHRDHCFKAEKYQAKTYYFATENREQLTKWVGAMNEAAMLAKKRKDSWMDVTSHNVGIPALQIRKAECCGYLYKASRTSKNFRRRYCIFKDACIYYYKNINSQAAQGMVHLHGYTVDATGVPGKKFSFILSPPEPQMRIFFFNAENETDKIRWMDVMSKSIQKWIKMD